MSVERQLERIFHELAENGRWQKIQTLLLGAIAAAVGVNLGVS